MYTTNFKFNGKTYSAKLVDRMLVSDDCEYYYLYVDEPQHKALLVKYNRVIDTAHLESWQQDILVETDKTKEEMAKAGEVVDSLRKKWEI